LFASKEWTRKCRAQNTVSATATRSLVKGDRGGSHPIGAKHPPQTIITSEKLPYAKHQKQEQIILKDGFSTFDKDLTGVQTVSTAVHEFNLEFYACT
jgi:hypothetical protein